jgi:hypothetical protein
MLMNLKTAAAGALLMALLALPGSGQVRRGAGRAQEPVELKGQITNIRLAAGNTPSVTVAAPQGAVEVHLGSMAYLVTNGFNPKLGEQAVIKALVTANGYVALVITLPAQKVTLRLRDDEGRPLWRGGRRGPNW